MRDRVAGTTERVSVSSGGDRAAEAKSYGAAISADGRFVVFHSEASNLVAGDTNGCYLCNDVFVRDRKLLETERASVTSSGKQARELRGRDQRERAVRRLRLGRAEPGLR